MKLTIPILLFLGITLFPYSTIHANSGPCDSVADSLELVNFYQQLDGPNWIGNSNWLVPGQPIENWFGISVNSEGCVTAIQLFDNDLSGTLYDIHLPQLIHLILNENIIQGSIPDFTSLPELQTLWVPDNQLTGVLPDFSNMPKLANIFLSNNSLSGALPDFTNVPLLISISIGSNQLTGTLPNFTNTPKLSNLSINDNRFSGEIPDFSNTPFLTTLDLRTNQLTGSIPNFSKLFNLQTLFLAENQLTGTLPDFSNTPFLEKLHVSDNQLTGTIPDFSNIPLLIYLNLSTNQFSGSIPNFSNIPNLEGEVWISSNQLSGNIPDFSNIPKIMGLFLRFNHFSGELPDLSNLPELTFLDISNNQLSEEIPNFSGIPKLLYLWLDYNQFIGQFPNFDNLPGLVYLQLDHNKLSGKIPSLSSIPNLSFLGVYDNFLSGVIPVIPQLNNYHLFNNLYTFSDIIESGNVSVQGFNYAPQKLFFQDTTILVKKDSPITIDLCIDEALTTSFYFWDKDSTTWNPPPGNDSKTNELIFNNPTTMDAGRYTATVVNPQANQLTLYSHTISLQVCDEQSDSLQLVELYNATNGSSWTNKDNWLVPGQPISTWSGVSTNAFGCVRKLDLSTNKLNGSVPALDLNTLDTLILRNNSLTGTLPELQTPFIRVLNLGSNQFNGNFPMVLPSLVDLTELDFSSNAISGAIPPDLGDLCELTTLRVDHNDITGELPEKLTLLFNLKKGQVDFSDNQIDSLKEKIIWFCPYGDTILQTNPSYDRFLGICNVQCKGDEWENLESFPWVVDTINGINCSANCAQYYAQAGFVTVRGIRVMFTLTRCYLMTGTQPVFTEEVRFFDCGGHLLETASLTEKSFSTDFGAISTDEFASLTYDIRWICGQVLDINTAIEKPQIGLIPDQQHVYQINCSPNPAITWITCGDHFDIRPTSIRILDMMGRTYPTTFQTQNQQITIDVHDLQAGIYILDIQGMNARYFSKVIIQ
ncbi:MAG: leucine-rich repeat domain-containing protein [Saprospiraceae bacterium]|nr:leucine-rich repeat domain-containing protein [Saprospiraceae bacterium]